MYYHASQTKDIKVLEPNISNHGKSLIYFSRKRENVLVYLSNSIEKYCKQTNFDYDGIYQKWGPYGFTKDGILRLEEYYKDALIDTYKGVSGYIYYVDEIDNKEEIEIKDVVVTKDNVEVLGYEFIEDAYEEILKAEKEGKIVIQEYKNMPLEQQVWLKKTIQEEYDNATNHPEYRHFLKAKFPFIKESHQ